MRKVKGDYINEGKACPDKTWIRHYRSERSRIRSSDKNGAKQWRSATDHFCVLSLQPPHLPSFFQCFTLIYVIFRNIPICKTAKLDCVGAKVRGGVLYPLTYSPKQWHCPNSLSCLQVLSETVLQAPINVLPLVINTVEQFQILLQEHQ